MSFIQQFPSKSTKCALSLLLGVFAATWPLKAVHSQATRAAQGESAICAAAARTADAGAGHVTEFDVLASCRSAGPDALANAWSRTGSLSAEDLASLTKASSRVRDLRLYRAVLSVGDDPSHATRDRIGALQALASYYNLDFSASARWLTTANVGDPIPRAAIAPVDTAGLLPLPTSLIADFPRFLARLANESRDTTVAHAALRLAQAIAWNDPEHIPVPPSAIQLVAGCGNRVILESTLSIVVPITIRVSGSSYDRTLTPTRWVGGPPNRITLALPLGTVVATYGAGHEIARLNDRNAPCRPGQVRWP
jgi:hypothetical protein